MYNWIKQKLNKTKCGIILNVDNSEISNDGEFITIKVPITELLKFGDTIISPNKKTKFIGYDGEEISGSGVSRILKEGGFKTKII